MRDALCMSLSLLSSTENESIQTNHKGFTFLSPAVKSKIAPLCKQPTWRVHHWTQSLRGIKAHTTITDLHHGKQMHALNAISNHRANKTSTHWGIYPHLYQQNEEATFASSFKFPVQVTKSLREKQNWKFKEITGYQSKCSAQVPEKPSLNRVMHEVP